MHDGFDAMLSHYLKTFIRTSHIEIDDRNAISLLLDEFGLTGGTMTRQNDAFAGGQECPRGVQADKTHPAGDQNHLFLIPPELRESGTSSF